jgi:hypothetical protein
MLSLCEALGSICASVNKWILIANNLQVDENKIST